MKPQKQGHKSMAFSAANFESKVISEHQLKGTASHTTKCRSKGGKGQRAKKDEMQDEMQDENAGIVMRPCPLSTLWQQI